ncbi:uncharacterized protein LOC135211670 [Macrobrachium nipponense]|uniref:uncharacterized protein LOC135211670 n=1 Tax=Macrobrachium nipponense TaxID=159736 RepID=UPI0030C8ABE9
MKTLALLVFVIAFLGRLIQGGTLPHLASKSRAWAFELSEPSSRNFQNRAEVRLPNGDVIGVWSILLHDGMIETISYNATDDGGFQRSVTYTPAGANVGQPQALTNFLSERFRKNAQSTS